MKKISFASEKNKSMSPQDHPYNGIKHNIYKYLIEYVVLKLTEKFKNKNSNKCIVKRKIGLIMVGE